MSAMTTKIWILLAQVLNLLMRMVLNTRMLRRLRDYQYDPHRPTLMCLSDDILLEILDLLGRPLSSEQNANCAVRIPFNRYKDRDALIAFSSVNSRLRSLAAPLVFNSIRIELFTDGLRLLAKSRKAQHNLRRLCFGPPRYRDAPRRPMSGEVPPLLEMMLQNMSNSLAVLEIDFPSCVQPPHDCELFSAALQLPAVKSLKVGPESIWIISRCPNVRSIGSTPDHASRLRVETRFHLHWEDLIESASRCQRLVHFQLEIDWRREVLKQILELMPGIESLGMPSEQWSETLHTMLPILARFRKLRTLHLPSAYVMSTEERMAVCGNPYLNESEATRLARRATRLRELDALTVELFNGQRTMSNVWFVGHDHATVRRDPDGRPLSIIWEHRSRIGCCDYWCPSRIIGLEERNFAAGEAFTNR